MSGAERGAAACGFEIHDAMGRLVWSLEVPAAIVRERLRSDEVLILPGPAPPLTDGRYEMTIRTAGEAGESFATRIPFVIRRPG
jgi:hypothetical protein